MGSPGGTRSYSYDALVRTTSITAPGMTYSYPDYDNVGNILTKQTEHGNYGYEYDDLYRLTDVTNPTLDDEAYSYDPVGNRLTASGVTGTIDHNANNELQLYGDVSFNYDANGNMSAKTSASESWEYTYNVQNRLVRVEEGDLLIVEYGYDPFGRRVWKEVDGERTYFLYADEGLVAEYDEAGEEIRSYGYRPDSIWGTNPLWLKEGGEYYWYQNDHLGTPQKLVDSTGTIVWSATYSAFGEASIDIELVTNNLRFPGQYFDVESGLHYNWSRYYDPESVRYTEVDPIGFDGRDDNLYIYVGNNPVNWTDPLGLYRSHWLLRAIVPGQVAWDHAVTAFELGDYVGATASTAHMLTEQVLFVELLGMSPLVEQWVVCGVESGLGVGVAEAATLPTGGFNLTGQLKTIWANRRLFLNWLKANQSLSRISNPLTHMEARQILDNAKKLGLNIDLNTAGLKGLEITGQWAGIPHFKVGSVHIPVDIGFIP